MKLRIAWQADLLIILGAFLCAQTLAAAASPSLFWVERRVPMDAPYAQTVAGNAQIYLIASTSSGLPSFAWSRDGLSWQQGEVPVGRTTPYQFISGAAWSNGTWMAVGPSGLVYISTDESATWQEQPRALKGAFQFRGVLGTPAGFLGFGTEVRETAAGFQEQTGLAQSFDQGRTWNSHPIPGATALNCGAVGSDLWLLAGDDGLVVKSTDGGNSWQHFHLNTRKSFVSAAVGNGVAVLVGAEGLLLRSLDAGETWEEIFPSGGEWIQTVVFAEGHFVLSGGGIRLAGATSPDGLQWTPASGTGAWGTLGYGPAGFLAVSGTYGFQNAGVNAPFVRPVSATGILQARLGSPIGRTLRASQRRSTFVGVGLPPGITLDADRGKLQGTPAKPGNYEGFLYALGAEGAGNARPVLVSVRDPSAEAAPHLSWRFHQSGAGLSNFLPTAMVYAEGGFVVAGETDRGEPGIVWSPDGSAGSWQKARLPQDMPPSPAWGALKTVVSDGEVCLAGGAPGLLLRSTDGGKTWHRLPAPIDRRFEMEGMAWEGGVFMVVGKLQMPTGGEGAGCLLSMDHGNSWEAVDLPGVQSLRAINFNGEFWIAVGERGTVIRSRSPNGPWEALNTPTLQTLRSLQSDGPLILAWAEGGKMLRSENSGDSWEIVSVGADYWPGSFVSTDGVFILSGSGKAAGVASRDGRSWGLPGVGAAYGVIAAGPDSMVAFNGGEVWTAPKAWPPRIEQTPTGGVLRVGEPFAMALSAQPGPVRWRAQRLPPGVRMHSASGLVSGAPTRPGIYQVRIVARNRFGASLPVVFSITVVP